MGHLQGKKCRKMMRGVVGTKKKKYLCTLFAQSRLDSAGFAGQPFKRKGKYKLLTIKQLTVLC